MPRAFVVHWDTAALPDAVEAVEVAGWTVSGAASDDPVLAAQAVARDPPDAVLVWLTVDPERGRRLGLEVLIRTKGVEVPIVYLDGSDAAVRHLRRVLPGCLYVRGGGVRAALREADRLGKAMRRAPPPARGPSERGLSLSRN